MTMKKLLIVFLFPLFLGCSSIKEKAGCAVEEKAVDVTSAGIVTVLECKNAAAVRMDVKFYIDKAGLCKTGLIGDLVCPIAVDAVLKGIGSATPATWQCNPANPMSKLSQFLVPACKAAMPVNER
jgi:hypothetical protein